jgi:glycerophosphoryl diester phosphodiesterase
MGEMVKEFGLFEDVILTMYKFYPRMQEVVDYCLANNIKVVAISEARVNAPFVHALTQNNINVYVHTINDVSSVNYFKEIGVQGFYTDYLVLESDPRMKMAK